METTKSGARVYRGVDWQAINIALDLWGVMDRLETAQKILALAGVQIETEIKEAQR